MQLTSIGKIDQSTNITPIPMSNIIQIFEVATSQGNIGEPQVGTGEFFLSKKLCEVKGKSDHGCYSCVNVHNSIHIPGEGYFLLAQDKPVKLANSENVKQEVIQKALAKLSPEERELFQLVPITDDEKKEDPVNRKPANKGLGNKTIQDYIFEALQPLETIAETLGTGNNPEGYSIYTNYKGESLLTLSDCHKAKEVLIYLRCHQIKEVGV